MNVEEIDKFLAEISVHPRVVVMNSKIWNGYWHIEKRNRLVSKIFRKIGRALRNRRIYWIGLPIQWIGGIKEWEEFSEIAMELKDASRF